jgi:hypothetical protein
MFHLVGVVAEERDIVAETYAQAIGTQSIFEAGRMTDYRQFLAWSRRSVSYKGRRVVLVLTDTIVPYLFVVKERYSPLFVSVRFDHTEMVFDYDAVFSPLDMGWGVDKSWWNMVADSRRPKYKPVFFMLNRDENIEREIIELGYDIAYGGPEKFYLGDVALQTRKEDVPIEMYNAAASGMAVISISNNSMWVDRLGAYDGVYLDDGVAQVVREVAGSDFLYAGLMARDMVPTLSELRVRIRSLLEKNLGNWA